MRFFRSCSGSDLPTHLPYLDALKVARVAVTLDVSGAEASFPFATQARKGPKVLDAGSYPQIPFVSTAVRPTFPRASAKPARSSVS